MLFFSHKPEADTYNDVLTSRYSYLTFWPQNGVARYSCRGGPVHQICNVCDCQISNSKREGSAAMGDGGLLVGQVHKNYLCDNADRAIHIPGTAAAKTNRYSTRYNALPLFRATKLTDSRLSLSHGIASTHVGWLTGYSDDRTSV